MKHIRLILPFRLPTWNQLLAMNHWERKKVRDWIKSAVSTCIAKHGPLPMQTDAVVRHSLTDLLKQEYLSMIVPNSSKKSRNRKRLEKMRLS
jgi:predicted alpha/beta hydrolase family esterase